MRARVVVITDRKQCDDLAARVAAILAAVPRGTVMIQVREKDLDGGPALALAQQLVDIARPAGAPVVINDRLDVAKAVRADGVHLPERGLTIDDARRIAGGAFSIGCSRHTVDAVLAAAQLGADLVQLGPIWATPGKGTPLGTEALAVRGALPPAVTLVAVGGIDGPARARAAAAAGADAVAVIRAAWQSADPGQAIAALVEAVESGLASRS
ncbi:MAG: thiamine phosphate synthase [Kofleriaceae bacterium]|nr:thiamine phosphate synthase [Kofleriaceae bacterium]